MPGVEGACKTVAASPYISAVLNFVAHLVGNGLARSLQAIDLSADETTASGTGKPVPYERPLAAAER